MEEVLELVVGEEGIYHLRNGAPFFAELADELLLYLNLYTDAIRFENEGR